MKINRGIESFRNRTYKLFKDIGNKFKKLIPNKPSVDDILKDIEINHNHSWYDELYNRNKNNLDDIALIYRGNKITYREMFDKMNQYAKALKSMNINSESEIPVCLSNCPEIVYLMGAASRVGARLNIFGSNYPTDYINEIIKGTNSNLLFIEDNYYEKIKSGIDDCNLKNIVAISLQNSLKNGNNPYEKIEKNPELFINKVEDIKKKDSRVLNQNEFIEHGKDYTGEIDAKVNIDHKFVITYTSGSTNEKRPKALIHSSRNFITVARFHDKDINGITTKSFTSLAHIPTFSNTNLVSCISDSLMQGAKLALEPVYDKDFFVTSLIIHKPHYVAATKSFWINMSKKVLYDKNYSGVKFENLLLAFSCGETFEINEEKFINKAIKKAKTGTGVTHMPYSIVRMSEAAGDCEHGSIFFTLFRSYVGMKPFYKRKHIAPGLTPFDFVELCVLDNEGNKLGTNQVGRIVANSPCTMIGYKNNEEANNKFWITDSTGKKWADMSLNGYLDDLGKVHIKGRINSKEIIPSFVLSDIILKDTKNILSCETVNIESTNTYVAHIELQPDAKKGSEYILNSIYGRCSEILDKYNIQLYVRVRDFNESYPLTASGKRDVKKLKAAGIDDYCIDMCKKNQKETVYSKK